LIRRVVFLFITLLLLQSYGGTSHAVTEDEIASLISGRYRITRPAFLGGFKEIGSVLVLRKEGPRANRPSKIFSPNLVKGHRIEKKGGGDLPPGPGVDPDLKIGDRLHLYGVQTGDGYVQLDLFTLNTFVVTGGTVKGPTPLQASTRFIYDEGLEAVTAERIFADIREWFLAEGESLSPSEAVRTGDGGAAKTVRLGQSREEVVAILGPPAKIFLLGTKSVFVYPDIKVIFIDGRVTNAE
jgi:hypothetical protein